MKSKKQINTQNRNRKKSVKNRTSSKSNPPQLNAIDPETALQFLEDMRTLKSEIEETTQLISIRIPKNLLRAIKTQANYKNEKYQRLIIQYIRMGLNQK